MGDSKVLEIGSYALVIDPRPSPLFANQTIQVRALVSDTTSGLPATDVGLRLEFVPPSGPVLPLNLSRPTDEYGYRLGSLRLLGRGNYTTHVILKNETGEHRSDTWFLVYPDLPIRVFPVGPVEDPYVDQQFVLTVSVINATTRAAYPALSDLDVVAEHWTDDHRTLLGSTQIQLIQSYPGTWIAQHSFPEAGMYHLKFSSKSGRFGVDDAPTYHLYVVNPLTRTEGGSGESPGPSWGLVAAFVVACALGIRAAGRRGVARNALPGPKTAAGRSQSLSTASERREPDA